MNTIFDIAEGERRKLDAHALLAARRETFILRGRRALLAALLDHGEATADDVRAVVMLPVVVALPAVNPVFFGSVPGEMARAGIIRRVGYTVTARPAAHARPVSVWALTDRAAAVAWLRDHPDRPDSEDEVFSYETNEAPDAVTLGASQD